MFVGSATEDHRTHLTRMEEAIRGMTLSEVSRAVSSSAGVEEPRVHEFLQHVDDAVRATIRRTNADIPDEETTVRQLQRGVLEYILDKGSVLPETDEGDLFRQLEADFSSGDTYEQTLGIIIQRLAPRDRGCRILRKEAVQNHSVQESHPSDT